MTKTDIENFNKVMAKYGGFWDIDNNQNIEETTQEGLKDFLNISRTAVDRISQYFENSPRIKVAFTRSTKLGAVVSKLDDTYFIGIYSGTAFILYYFFSWMLRCPRVLPEIGDSSKEEIFKLEDPHLIDFVRLLDTLYLDDDYNPLPKDPKRAHMVEVMIMHALVFLTLHELGHILRGHMNYKIKSKVQSSFIDSIELNMFSDDKDGLLSQAMEIDADGFASHYSLVKLQGMFEYMQNKNEYSTFKDFPQLLGTWVFSISTLFRLFGMFKYDTSKLKQYSHPPAGFRATGILKEVDDAVLKGPISHLCSPDFKQNVQGFFFYYLSQVENAFEDMSLNQAVAAEGAQSLAFAHYYPNHVHDVIRSLNEIKVSIIKDHKFKEKS